MRDPYCTEYISHRIQLVLQGGTLSPDWRDCPNETRQVTSLFDILYNISCPESRLPLKERPLARRDYLSN